MTDKSADRLTFPVHGDIISVLHTALVVDHGLRYSDGDAWESDKRWEPEVIVQRVAGFHSGSRTLGWHKSALVILSFGRGNGLTAGVFAPTPELVRETLAFIHEQLPTPSVTEDPIVPVTFWTHNQHHGATDVTRKLTVPSWGEIQPNYAYATQERLQELMALTEPVGGRLYVWHGPPGTGKTYALRALAWEWRKWADVHYLVEPESFFGANPADLMELAMPDDDDEYGEDGEAMPKSYRRLKQANKPPRWRLLVMEDAGEMISRDAKINVGQSLSRLLNLVDGLIGQGLRVMVLLTTNEPLGQLHPAIARPGRTGMEIKFEALGVEQANRWLERHESAHRVAEAKTLAELYGLVGAWHARDGDRPVGFRPQVKERAG